MGAVMPAWFTEQMRRLVVLRFPPADMAAHWEALADVPQSVLSAAVTQAQRSRVEFPTPAELRHDCDLVRRQAAPVEPDEDRGADLPEPMRVTVPGSGVVIAVTREWRYYCERCSDSGWATWWCGEAAPRWPWGEAARCERYGEHGSHEWVGPCACWDSNPALIRKRDAQRQYAAAKAGKAA